MTGTIAFTNGLGGKISVGSPPKKYSFAWSDCGPDVSPSSVGHGTPVEFYEERGRAIAVRRPIERRPAVATHARQTTTTNGGDRR